MILRRTKLLKLSAVFIFGEHRLFKHLTVILAFLMTLSSSVAAAEYFVFYSGAGTVANSTNPTAIAIQYEYDGPSPLRSALIKFFNGPSDDEAAYTGAIKPFQCDFGDFTLADCSAADVFKSVRIENETAYIEFLGMPVASTSGYWMGFIVPLKLTVTQFSNVSDLKFVVMGVELDSAGEGCPTMCFTFGWTAEEIQNWRD